MLYNPDWQKQNVKGLFTLPNLIAWLEKQPADEEYCSTTAGSCLMAQWARSIDKNADVKPYTSYSYNVFGQEVYLGEFGTLVYHGDGSHWSTFGDALERAKALV